MPNWCYNSVTISNEDTTKIDGLVAELEKEDAEIFQYLRPNPAAEWDYGWSVENWGTKWDTNVQDWTREDDTTIVMHFDTAWAPPITLFDFLVEQGWSIRAMYHEPGMGFAGCYEDGNDDCYEYDYTNREDVENLPDYIQDFTGALEELERYEEELDETKMD